jgi:2,4-dienoyl-CoA reductase-like NADH-dependent reductase (Old Yellow Enzyme family)
MGDLLLPNRIVMAPLSRMRAANPSHVPNELMARYYAQRASAGVIIGECTAIGPEGYGWADTPGLWSDEQVRGWRLVSNAVHRNPDLVARFVAGVPLADVQWKTVYASGREGYIDYPEMENALAR